MKVGEATNETAGQYSLLRILGIWALAAAPMGLLAWAVYPAARNRVDIHPGLLLWILMIAGLMRDTLLSFGLIYAETGRFSIDALRRSGVAHGAITPATRRAEPSGYNLGSLLELPGMWRGVWCLFGLWMLQMLGNDLWGEEPLFRGVLLPKMRRAFGRWDWLANAILHARVSRAQTMGHPLCLSFRSGLCISGKQIPMLVVRSDRAWCRRTLLSRDSAGRRGGPYVAFRAVTRRR